MNWSCFSDGDLSVENLPLEPLLAGRYYLPNGTESDWWTKSSADRFSDARQCAKDHFSNVVVGPYNDEDSTLVKASVLSYCFNARTVKEVNLWNINHSICIFLCASSWMLSAFWNLGSPKSVVFDIRIKYEYRLLVLHLYFLWDRNNLYLPI